VEPYEPRPSKNEQAPENNEYDKGGMDSHDESSQHAVNQWRSTVGLVFNLRFYDD
jgi:hypothetical protein